jgi:hypothetical protein
LGMEVVPNYCETTTAFGFIYGIIYDLEISSAGE